MYIPLKTKIYLYKILKGSREIYIFGDGHYVLETILQIPYISVSFPLIDFCIEPSNGPYIRKDKRSPGEKNHFSPFSNAKQHIDIKLSGKQNVI